MDSHSTPPAATSTPPTLVKQGAGVGAAIGTAISTCIALGLGSTWYMVTPNAPLYAVGGVLATAVAGMICGAVIGWSVPVVETKTDHTATH